MSIAQQFRLAVLAVLAAAAMPGGAAAQTPATAPSGEPVHSALWGTAGEKWNPAGRLPDFSFAGYRCGEKPIPLVPQRGDVTKFGAKGDGVSDDTKAFQDALAATVGGALYVPPGRYVIKDVLVIDKPNLVLRGTGADKTILYFPEPLNTLKPNWSRTSGGKKTSGYSWGGGFLSIGGATGGGEIAPIAPGATRGQNQVTLGADPAQPLQPGRRVQVVLTDDEDKSLVKYLYSGQPGDIRHFKSGERRVQACRVVAVEGRRVTLDRPLRFDLRGSWKPRLCEFVPAVTESGVESLAFEFPKTPYKGHFTEQGYNALNLGNAADCWARNIRIRNADSGIFIRSTFCTVRDVVVESDRAQGGHSVGHHGLCVTGADNVVTGFEFTCQYIHDLTVSHATGNVLAGGKGPNLAFDHHCGAPYENLFTDIDVGAGGRIWSCGGGEGIGLHCGARGTFWNIRSRRPTRYPRNFGPLSMNFVGVQTDKGSTTQDDNVWFEALPPGQLSPANLYDAQLARRLSRTPR
ncbi:MAG: glycosyl hydrolase family 28-related protein [Planctomycetota bacterium]|nr:glycosyl hydrolase family 28-related protein [Planctomycetota bacterium]